MLSPLRPNGEAYPRKISVYHTRWQFNTDKRSEALARQFKHLWREQAGVLISLRLYLLTILSTEQNILIIMWRIRFMDDVIRIREQER